MKKKTILLAAITTAVISAAITGCGADSKAAEVTTAGTMAEVSTEAVQDTAASETPEGEAAKETTLGIFKSVETIGENERQALFTDEYGNDFIANISEITEVPEELKEGETYQVTHSNIMTMSLPGIYPQVYSIELSEEKVEPAENPGQNGRIPNGLEETQAK